MIPKMASVRRSRYVRYAYGKGSLQRQRVVGVCGGGGGGEVAGKSGFREGNELGCERQRAWQNVRGAP